MYDLLVTGGTVVTPTATDKLDVAVEGEQIAAVERPGALGREGVHRMFEPEMSDAERRGLQHSADAIRSALSAS